MATDPSSTTRKSAEPASHRTACWRICSIRPPGGTLWRASNIYAPTLVIAGFDTWSFPEDREGLMRDLVHAPVKRSVLIPDATHFVRFEKHSMEFFEPILKFLKE